MDEANLGCATTEELIRELIARFKGHIRNNSPNDTILELNLDRVLILSEMLGGLDLDRVLILSEMLGGLGVFEKEYRTVDE